MSIAGCMCPLLAQSGHLAAEFQCPLLGVKRTSGGGGSMPGNDQSGHEQLRIAALQTAPEPHSVGQKSLL
jgi:hypothetical protein